MRPSQYHYIKRMWTRNMYKKKRTGCLSNFLKFFLFLFIGGMIAYTGIAAFVIMLCIVPVIGFIYIFIRIFRWALSKKNYSHITKNKPTPNSGENFIIDYDTLSAKESLQRTKKLAEIINTTTDRDEFESLQGKN